MSKTIVVVVPLTVPYQDLGFDHAFALIADPEYPSKVSEVDGRAVAWAELPASQQAAYVEHIDHLAEALGFDTTEPETHSVKDWKELIP